MGMMRLGYAHYILGVKCFYASTLSGHDGFHRETSLRQALAAGARGANAPLPPRRSILRSAAERLWNKGLRRRD